MSNQAIYLLFISGGLMLLFLVSIILAWLYAHLHTLTLNKMTNRLQELFSSFILAESNNRKDMNRLVHYVKNKKLRTDQLIHLITQSDEELIRRHEEQVMSLYNLAGIQSFLLKRLSTRNTHEQALACRRIGDLRISSMEDDVAKLLSSKSNDVFYHALLALAKLGDTDRLIRILTTNSDHIRLSFRVVIEIITAFTGSKEELFKNTIEHSDEYIKGILIKASAEYQYEDLSEYYVKYLSSDNKNLRIACIRALSELENPAYEQEVIGMLADPDWEVRAAAAKSLEKIGTSHSFEALGETISDSEWWVRHNAASSLVSIPGGKEFAYKMIDSKDRFAREAVIASMERSA